MTEAQAKPKLPEVIRKALLDYAVAQVGEIVHGIDPEQLDEFLQGLAWDLCFQQKLKIIEAHLPDETLMEIFEKLDLTTPMDEWQKTVCVIHVAAHTK